MLLFFTFNCSLDRVSNTHGFRFVESKFDKIQINITNKNDVRKIIGPPSSISNFDDKWFYIERNNTNQSLFKLGKKKIAKNNILVLEFNEYGMVSDKLLLNLNSNVMNMEFIIIYEMGLESESYSLGSFW